MHDKSRAYLFDMLEAVKRLSQFREGKSFKDYESDAYLRSAIERQLEIVGEALSRLAKIDPETAARVPDHERIISFRNLLIHGYRSIAHNVVWDILDTKVPPLRETIERLLREPA
jgi:uncharacterized protein with HEPN domain